MLRKPGARAVWPMPAVPRAADPRRCPSARRGNTVISLDTAIAFAIRDSVVMDHLGEALQSDIVTSNPYQRRIVEFADKFLVERRKLPGDGDWQAWLLSLDEGPLRDGTRETLGRLWAIDTSGFDPSFFSERMVEELQKVATHVAKARINSLPDLDPVAFQAIAEKVANVRGSGVQGLARLDDISTWVHPVREDAYIGTGFPTLDNLIGGWGKELWLLFADSGVGKSILLQNFAVNAAVRGKNVLHVSLELGLRPQIHRYYRQITEASRAEFNNDRDEMTRRLRHWFKIAKGSIYLLEYPAYSVSPENLRRTIDRVSRIAGKVDLLVLDYLDLMVPTKKNSKDGGYADLGYLTHETRALTGAFDLTVLSASQSVRKPANANRLTMQDMGDSYNKVRGADGLLSLVQTPDEEELFQGRLGVLKVRDSGGRGTEVGLYINRELSLIQELTHPNVVQLMTRLGHLPSQLQRRPAGMTSIGATP